MPMPENLSIYVLPNNRHSSLCGDAHSHQQFVYYYLLPTFLSTRSPVLFLELFDVDRQEGKGF
jgi:hypothetical protein